ncbi:hypothetical protein AJ78_07861 [Emergomyces pasteurianus Ep9510]|uniref:Glutamyl/glutaminyl-tRNA synthetase class Ib catalytic domain-containing protein n=1 Tax=Emergomyces pasteurianus Ep9510 TaxID=1447872 RepID=A0A1J9Q5Z0_9EURO|nr:hypothetical protein AJ78_07861 [Emergomyces pasteurianus Ep9510]
MGISSMTMVYWAVSEKSFNMLQAGNKDLVVEWVTQSLDFTPSDFRAVKRPLSELEHHFTLRYYILRYFIRLADIVVWGTIRGNKVLMSTIKRQGGNVGRWFALIESTNSWITRVILDLHVPARRKRVAGSVAGRSYDIGLDIEDIVTRFPPEPSGYLHIGHAKAALLKRLFCAQKSGGNATMSL